ncbi:MAG: CcoQ/FixQ family Cbb3-type cytochrome c oxidase assembly chaperone [Tepidiphilus sp.]|jgi:cytochrome c oxidase cbb3-type subunit 4|uniref:CcoQ/FixQ family Cbb3-type cytochrome c oxidase assembly chaperone n=1 Tax=Tepidiphilus baoligensis TaxID=2698687 RepID=A0ABX1QHL0_9PROT|nr:MULTISPECIES: CcoQ/FixQ family Cbb3-type cytochrome c oxidase assembly chaperone [Tepidiphilus]MDD2407530.1 CcoQ/FixQ family Cbb3-type cytochrome c oxidase assembly chaperone [Tepidiphilus sp.]MDD3432410.1 CcoQ/FixQ family Cbb3-type cytochrome c oxidase assembly chaperone [Tepidiphilus sp.]NMH15635.1 CcoQ/FixQ family Cbb3-type cytochrome c oxidase assembly chaperone [Tepidiphilus baoligensis]
MDINDLRSAVTVAAFLCFLGICVWAYSRAAKPGFEEASRLPFLEDDEPMLANDHTEGK